MKKLTKILLIISLFFLNFKLVSAETIYSSCEAGKIRREGNNIIWSNINGCYYNPLISSNVGVGTAQNIEHNNGYRGYGYQCGKNSAGTSNECIMSKAINYNFIGDLYMDTQVGCDAGGNCTGKGTITIPISSAKKYIFLTSIGPDQPFYADTVTLYKDISACLRQKVVYNSCNVCTSKTPAINDTNGTKHYSMSGVNTETGQGINASCNNKGECTF